MEELEATGNQNRRVGWHAVCVGIVVLASLLLFYKHFLSRGMLMHVDMTFPTTIDRNLALYNHTWWQYGSVQNIWNLQRVLWAYPLLGLAWAVRLPMELYLLTMFVSTFALAGVSMYALAFDTISRFFSRNVRRVLPGAVFAGSVFAALIFMYNPFSVSHLWPYFGYPGYAALPLVFLLLVKAVERPRAWKVVLLAVIITVAGTGPINVVWYWFMIAGYLLFFVAAGKFERASLASAGKVLLPLVGLYALLNAMWLVPYAGAEAVNKTFTPVYANTFSSSTLDLLSRNGTAINNIRFTSGWGLPVEPTPSGPLQAVLSFTLPVLAVAAFVILRKKVFKDRTLLFWLIMFAASVLLATGTSWIIAGPYRWFVFDAPWISSLGWVFRAADRWLVYAAFFYALLLGLLVSWLLKDAETVRSVLAACAIAVMLASFAPIAYCYANRVYDPTRIPDDYAKVTRALERMDPVRGAIWVPFARDGFRYRWAPDKRIGSFAVYSSGPSLNNLQDIFSPENYYSFVEDVLSSSDMGPMEALNRKVMVPDNVATNLFMPLAGRYVVLDSSVPGFRSREAIRNDRSLERVLKSGDLEVFELARSVEPVKAVAATVNVNNFYDLLALASRLPPEEYSRLAFAGTGSPVDEKHGGIFMDRYMEPFDINSGFEKAGPGGMPDGWAPVEAPLQDAVNPSDAGRGARASLDREEKAGGAASIRVENPPVEQFKTHSIEGPAVPAVAGEIYGISSWVKYANAEWSRVSVEGYDQAAGHWVPLVNCPVVQSGTSGWKNEKCSFHMPEGISMMRPVLIGGWAKNPRRPAVTWFDDIEISRLGKGFYEELTRGDEAPAVTWKRRSPEDYEVRVKGADRPFVIAFAQAYDRLWVGTTEEGEPRDPVRLISTINGFEMARKGDFKMNIRYQPQGWFVASLLVSLAAMGLCLGFLCLALAGHSRPAGRLRAAGSPAEAEHSAGEPLKADVGRGERSEANASEDIEE